MSFGCIGRCDFCQFNKVKVSPLTCMQHFYCQTCRKYIERLQKNDFSCKLCDRKQRQAQSERRRESRILDDFIQGAASRNTPTRGFQDVAITMTGSKVISLEDDKEDEEDDLSGNNDEWEYLISSLSYTPSFSGAKRTTGEHFLNRDADTESEGGTPDRKHRSQAKYKSTNREHDGSYRDSPSGDTDFQDDSHMFNWYLTRAKAPAPATAHETEGRDTSGVRSNMKVKLPSLKTLDSASSSSDHLPGTITVEKKPNRTSIVNPCWDNRSQSGSDEWATCFSRNGMRFGEDENVKTQIEVTKAFSGTDQAYQKPSPTPFKDFNSNPKYAGSDEVLSQLEQIARHNSEVMKNAKYLNLDWSYDGSRADTLTSPPRDDISDPDYQDKVEGPGFDDDKSWANSFRRLSPADLTDSFWD